jgi:hypothetical protein
MSINSLGQTALKMPDSTLVGQPNLPVPVGSPVSHETLTQKFSADFAHQGTQICGEHRILW